MPKPDEVGGVPPNPEPVPGSALLPYAVDEASILAAGYRLRPPTLGRAGTMGPFMDILKGLALGGAEVDGEGLLRAFLGAGWGDDVFALTVEHADGTPLTRGEPVPSFVGRAAVVLYFIEVAQAGAVLNGPAGLHGAATPAPRPAAAEA